jgi:hypothetical protein
MDGLSRRYPLLRLSPLFFLFCLFLTVSSTRNFRVGLVNIYFFAALFEDNLKKPLFKPLKSPPSKVQEEEIDRLSLEYLARYFRYLDADVLGICEAPSQVNQLEGFVKRYLQDEYLVVHNSPVVKNRKYYYNQQVAFLVRRNLFNLVRYEALEDKEITTGNQKYPYPENKVYELDGKEIKVWWSRFPIEMDLALKGDPDHWYKFILTYPKSKFARSQQAKREARVKNFVQQQMVRSRLEAVSGDFDDIFVLGDMNDALGMEPVEKSLGLDSIQGLYHGKGDDLLWNPLSFAKGEGTYIYKGHPEIIDYIFLSHGLKSGKGTVTPSTYEHFHFFKTMVRQFSSSRPDRLRNRELFLSDHAPLTLNIRHDPLSDVKGLN